MAKHAKSQIALAVVLVAAIALSACGSGKQSGSSVTTQPNTEQAKNSTGARQSADQSEAPPLPQPSPKQIETSTMPRPSAWPPAYYMTEYDAETTWENTAGDRRVGDYLESVWRDPASPTSELQIDSRPSKGAPRPLAAAEQARVQASGLPEYHERSLKKIKLGDRATVRFAYDAEGESYVAFFFEDCDTTFNVRGSTLPTNFRNFSEYYGLAASRIEAVCGR